MEFLLDGQVWASLATLTALEIVLGIDHLVFIAILSNALPGKRQRVARRLGLALAVISRLALLTMISWLASVTSPLFAVGGHGVSVRDLVLFGGGLFLLAKGTTEIHHTVEGVERRHAVKVVSFGGVLARIVLLDVVFSLDSVITAVGMARHLAVMAAAIIIAVAIMLFAADPLARFIDTQVSVKILALSFLILVGVALVADGLGFHIPKGYLYFAIAFSIGVEFLNLSAARRRGHAAR